MRNLLEVEICITFKVVHVNVKELQRPNIPSSLPPWKQSFIDIVAFMSQLKDATDCDLLLALVGYFLSEVDYENIRLGPLSPS